MQSAKRKANEMPPEPPAKRFLGGRQLIIENIAPGTTKDMIAQLLHPFEVMDDASLDELESGASLRRSVLVTLKRGNGVEEVDEAISRFSGTVLNGNLVTLRLFGKPASRTIQEASAQNRETFLSSPPDRMTRTEIRRRPVPLSPPPTAPTQSCAAGSEPVVKVERDIAVIVVHQYADVDIKQEPVAGSDFALSEGTERSGEGQCAGDRTAGERSTEDQESARVQDAQNINEEHISSTIVTTPTSVAPRKRRTPLSFWGRDRTENREFVSRGAQTERVHIFASAASGEDGSTPAVETDLELALKYVDNYAGPKTADLEQRFDRWVADGKLRDCSCLLCLRETSNDDLKCISCTRDYHAGCLKNACMQAGLASITDTSDRMWFCCPLCLRRTWNVADPKERRRRRRVINRYSLARAFQANPSFRVWIQWEDTGSMISDQALLLGLDVMPDADEIRARRQEANLRASEERTWREKLNKALKTGLSRMMDSVFMEFPRPSQTLERLSVHLCKPEQRLPLNGNKTTMKNRERVTLSIMNNREVPVLYDVRPEAIAYGLHVYEETGFIKGKSEVKVSVTLDPTRSGSWEENDRREIRVYIVALDQDLDIPQLVEYIDKVDEMGEISLAVAGDVYPLLFWEPPQDSL